MPHMPLVQRCGGPGTVRFFYDDIPAQGFHLTRRVESQPHLNDFSAMPSITDRIPSILSLFSRQGGTRRLVIPIAQHSTRYFAMKRTATAASLTSGAKSTKKPRPAVPEYHLTPSVRNEDGSIVWPAPEDKMEAARSFIRECVAAGKPTLIVPDKDADGLTSGVILHRTLVLLGLDSSLISSYHPPKGTNIHDASCREAMSSHNPAYIFVLDQGSRPGPPLIDAPHRGIVIDHHHALEDDHPKDSLHVTACNSPPVAASSLLTYLICRELHEGVQEACDWLCAMGTHGDLGNTLKWEPPFPDMKPTFKTYTKKAINDAVSLINAPRKTASYDVPGAWDALLAANSPKDLLSNKTLLAARADVNAEVERCTHTPPKFSSDGRVAVFRISSQAQVHPVIATRWAGHLSSARLEVVLVANEGYLPDLVNFSCRIPRCARAKEPPVNIIEVLNEVAAKSEDATLRERLGHSFARGHKEASGGIVPKAEFEELMAVMEVGKKVERESPKKARDKPAQGNTLLNYFGKS